MWKLVIRKLRGDDGSNASEQQSRPGWSMRMSCSVLLLIWRTILLVLTWHDR